MQITNRMTHSGYIDDVDFDNGFVYYNQIIFEGAEVLMNKLRNHSSAEYDLFAEAISSPDESYKD